MVQPSLARVAMCVCVGGGQGPTLHPVLEPIPAQRVWVKSKGR